MDIIIVHRKSTDFEKLPETYVIFITENDVLKHLKRAIAISLCLVMIFGLAACGSKAIGTVGGIENEYITIDGLKYVLDTSNSFSSADRDKYLGKVSNSSIAMKVYSVKGDINYILHAI